jgi:hypothetical protein
VYVDRVDDEILYRTFESPVEAEMLAGLLRSEGIRVRVADAQAIGVQPLWSNALGGVKLYVPAADTGRADEIVRDVESRAKSEATNDAGDDGPVVPGRADADAAARRAFNASVVGFGFCPGILHLYSLSLVTRLDRSVLSERGRRKRAWALTLDILALAAIVAVVVAKLL